MKNHISHQVKKWIATPFLAYVASMALPVAATENGLITYPLGVNTVLNGILPQPGAMQFYSYSLYYSADKFTGKNKESLLPGYKSEVYVEAPRIMYTWGEKIGPFTLSSGVVQPLLHLKVAVPGASDSDTAIGDTILQPIYLGYSNESHTLFAFANIDIGLKNGRYDKNRVSNAGRNVYALIPSLDITWFPTADWELSATNMYEVSSPNHDTGYHSGAVTSLEFLAGYTVAPKWQVGVQGYALKQFSDDKVAGSAIPNGGFRGQTMAIGPQLRYDFAPGSGVVIKYQHEFNVKNRSKGDKLWVEVTFPM